MIINLLLNFILLVFGALFSFLPVVRLRDIPVIGFYVEDYLIFAVGVWNSFMDTFPYAQTLWFCFLWLLVFESFLLLAKFFLGHRLPANSTH